MEESVRLCRIWGRVVLETRLPVGKVMPLFIFLLQYKPSRGPVVDWETGENCQMGYSIFLFLSLLCGSLLFWDSHFKG